MDAALIDRIETNVERIASATFAAAVGYAVYGLLVPVMAAPQLAACMVGGGAIAYVICAGLLGAVAPRKPRFAVSIFDVRHIDASELLLTDSNRLEANELLLTDADRLAEEELVLTDADRLDCGSPSIDPFVLDDILVELGPNARVVRLFDPKAMPTPGQLKSRIDSYIEKESPASGASDASQALSDALAELRRSLR